MITLKDFLKLHDDFLTICKRFTVLYQGYEKAPTEATEKEVYSTFYNSKVLSFYIDNDLTLNILISIYDVNQ